MALDPSGLTADLTANFATPGATYAACGQQWADAMQAYATGIVPASTTVTTAAATLASDLAAAFALADAIPSMETAFATFAATVGLGMAPAFTAVPPPGAAGFAAQFGGGHPVTHADAASAISGIIDTWMRTGTATPSGGGAPVPWS